MASPFAAAARPGRRRTLALWLMFVAATALISARTTYVADLSAFLPSTPSAEQSVLLDQLRTGVAARLVLVGIDGGTAAQRRQASTALAARLRDSGEFDAVHNGDNAGFEATARFLFEHRYLLSPGVDAQRFTVEGLRAGIEDTTSMLGTPAGAMIKAVILRDPTGESVRMAQSMLPAQAPRSDGQVWVSRDASRAVMVLTTRAAGADLDAQERALQRVRHEFAAVAPAELRLLVSGSGTFAVASRGQIKSQVERLAAAGGALIMVLLLMAFGGSLRTLLTALAPVGTGVLAGIAAVSVVHGNVHGITLGFGTTLIGEAVDYAIYYLIQARPGPPPSSRSGAARWLEASWPTVRLGLWTSVCGFAALLFSGFPGLAQLGLFSMAGLMAAALTTRLIFPILAPDGAPGVGMRRRLGRAVGWATAWLPRARWPLMALTLCAALALALLPSPWRGDLGSLSPMGADRLQIDTDLRNDLGASDGGILIAASGPDEASALERAEAAGARLDRLVEDGTLRGYESPAQILPSPAVQRGRRAALPDAPTLQARLAQATVDGPLPARRLSAFVDDVQAARTQPVIGRATLQGTPLAAALDALLVAGDGTRAWCALISLQAGEHGVSTERLRAALQGVAGVQVVAVKPELDALYARYLHEASWQALLGALAVCVLLALHLRSASRLWRIAQPVAAAVLIVVAALGASGVALGILHLVGLLLTVAIGSNYALFFDQIRLRQDQGPPDQPLALDRDTLASLALANLTAVVSFGLLATSSIPALSAVGRVAAPGILLSLLLSAAFIPSRRRATVA